MEDSAFSQEFCAFIRDAVPSVDAAELLLFLFRNPDRRWTLSELLSALPADVNMAEKDAVACLETLRSRGLVELDEEKRVRYRAADPLDAHVRTLAQAYDQRPVTLIRMIYALRDSAIQSFADAFKFQKR
jgi:DNA-binding IclR family transcriptional regulator